MSPVFTPDFTTVDANIPIYEKGRYNVQVTKRTPFIKEKSDNEGNVSTQVGIRYNLEMVGMVDDKGKVRAKDESGENIKGKTVSPYTIWLHTEGGWQYGKPFLMATAGYNPRNQEKEANEKLFQANDWTIKGEPGASAETIDLGNGWDIPVGRVVSVFMQKDVQPGKDGGPDYVNQDFGGWVPVE